SLELEPRFRPAHEDLARLYVLEKRQDEALPHLRAAAAGGPLERDLAMPFALLEMSSGNTAAAERELASLAARFGSVQALLHLARSRSARGDKGAALEALRQARAIA